MEQATGKLKVFFVDPQSYNNLSLYDVSLMRGMKNSDMHYFCNVLYQEEVLDGVNYQYLFHYNKHKSKLLKALSYTKSMCKLSRKLINLRPEMVHIQWIRLWLIDILFVFLCHCLGIKVVHTAHNALSHWPKPGDNFRFRTYYSIVDAIIVHTPRTRDELQQVLHVDPSKISIIRHGILRISADKEKVSQRVSELREQLGIDANTIVLSCLGKQNKYKGTEIVLQAWKDSGILQSSNVRLLIAGYNQGVDYSPAEGIGNISIIDGMVSDTDFAAYVQLSSVMLLPYTNISQSGVLFTAIEAGIPVAVTDVGGLTDVFEFGNVGWQIGSAEYDNIRKCLEHLATSAREVEDIRSNTAAFDAVRSAYDWYNISQETYRLYQTIL